MAHRGPRSIVHASAEKAPVFKFRRHTLLPVDDVLESGKVSSHRRGTSGFACAGGRNGSDGGSRWPDAKLPGVPDALLDQLLSGADPKTAFDPNACSAI